MSAPGLLLVFTAALLAGAVNSIAGGGTLLTFPALVWLGLPPISANATSTVALWPGSFGSMWAYRGQLEGTRRWLLLFTIPSVAGGIVGAQLLLHTSAARFDAIVPFLVLGATVLFVLQQPLSRRLARRATEEHAIATGAAAAVVHGSWPGSSASRSTAATSARASASSCWRRSARWA